MWWSSGPKIFDLRCDITPTLFGARFVVWHCDPEAHVTDDYDPRPTTVAVNGRGVNDTRASGSGKYCAWHLQDDRNGGRACMDDRTSLIVARKSAYR